MKKGDYFTVNGYKLKVLAINESKNDLLFLNTYGFVHHMRLDYAMTFVK